MTVTAPVRPERLYPPLHFEARDEMPEEYRKMVLRLLRETNEIGSVPVCYQQMRSMTQNVRLAPDPVSRVRIVDFFADEMRHQKIFDGIVRAMGVVPDDDFVSSIDGLNATSAIGDWTDLALLNTFIDRVGGFQLFDYAQSSFAPLARAGVSVAKDEMGHCAMGFQHLREICATAEGRRAAAERLPRWYGMALDMFGTSSGTRQWKYIELGLKTKSNEELRQEFIVHIAPYFEAIGLEQPAPDQVPRQVRMSEDPGRVRASGTTQIDDWLSLGYARLMGLDDPVQTDPVEARARGYRNVVIPEGQLFLATRVGDGDVAVEALGLPEGFGSVVTGLATEYLKPVEAGQPFTVRVRRLPAPAPPSKRVKEYHQLEYELTDVDGEVAVRQYLTVAEFHS